MINVNVFSEDNNWSNKIKNKEIFFQSICEAFPKKYKFLSKNVSFTLLLSNNKKIKKLNKKFRNKNKPTDVLSFPLSHKTSIKKDTYLGDIIISFNYMNKEKEKKLFKKAVIKTFIHGYLHLLGFDHIKDKDYKKMITEEKKIYKLVISKLN